MINNNLTEDYCSFEVAKLLKEKGFDIECAFCFIENGKRKPRIWVNKNEIVGWEVTTALAIRWVSINYGKNKISHLKYEMSFEEIDKELLNILKYLKQPLR